MVEDIKESSKPETDDVGLPDCKRSTSPGCGRRKSGAAIVTNLRRFVIKNFQERLFGWA